MNSAVLKLFLLHILGTIKSVDMQSYFKLELRGFMERGQPNYIQFVTEIDPKTRTNNPIFGTLTDLEMKGRIPQNNQPSVSDVGKSMNNENKNLKRKDPSADVDLTVSLRPSRKIFKSSIPNIDQNLRFANPQGSLHQAYSIGATQARDPQQPDDKNKPAVLMKSFSDSTKAARPGLPSGDLSSALLPRSYNLGGSKLSATASGISSHGKESHTSACQPAKATNCQSSSQANQEHRSKYNYYWLYEITSVLLPRPRVFIFQWTKSTDPRLYHTSQLPPISGVTYATEEKIISHELRNQILVKPEEKHGYMQADVTVFQPSSRAATIFDICRDKLKTAVEVKMLSVEVKVQFDYGGVVSTIDSSIFSSIQNAMPMGISLLQDFECDKIQENSLPTIYVRLRLRPRLPNENEVSYAFTQKEYIVERKNLEMRKPMCFIALQPWNRKDAVKKWIIGGTFSRRYATRIQLDKNSFEFVEYTEDQTS